MLLRRTGHADAFWFVFAWGAAATVGAAVGPLQARVLPRLSGAREWLSQHRDLGPRYLAEGTANSAATQLRNYGVGLMLGLAAVGYVQASTTLMGPFMVIFFGMGLVTLPEAARVLHRSPRYLPVFCAADQPGARSGGRSPGGPSCWWRCPEGSGNWLLPQLWRPTYPLILPLTISVMGGCVQAGAGTGLHALGAARRSLRAMVVSSVIFVVCGVAGTAAWRRPSGSMCGIAVAGMARCGRVLVGAALGDVRAQQHAGVAALRRQHAAEPGQAQPPVAGGTGSSRRRGPRTLFPQPPRTKPPQGLVT